MAIYDLGTASLAANGDVTGVGTTWKAPLTLIRVGATIVFKTEPVQIYTISEIISDTQIKVYNPKSETVTAGTGYAILAHDGITVPGLAQDVAETLRHYQSKETEVADAVDAFNNFDPADFESKVAQVNTQYGDFVTIAAQVSSDAYRVSLDKDATALNATSASNAASTAQIAADRAEEVERNVQLELNSILSVHSRVFSVDDPQFAGGAKGDSDGTAGNGTDDTAAIYACFQAAITAGGGKIVFTPGKTYRTTYTVIYGSNTLIDMQGASIFFDVKPNDGSVFMPDSFQSYTKFTTDVIFMNGQINGKVGAGNGIGANRARRITLFNIGSKYLHWHLFDGAGAQQVKIINCWCEGTNSAPFQADNAAYSMACWGIDASGTVLPISFDATGAGGWANCRDMLVMGCIVRNARHSCVHIHNTRNQNIQVVNCHFEDSAAGVFADDNPAFVTSNTLIQGCTFIRCTIPINWSGGFNVLRILDNHFYGENNTTWYYGIRILLTAAGTLKTLAIKGNTFTGLYRPIYVNGAFGFAVDENIFQTCGGTAAPSDTAEASKENPLAILRISGGKSGTVANNIFQDCNTPVCISVARDQVDNGYSVSVEVLNNIARGSGCLLSLYYADRCSVRNNKYVGLANDFYAVYAASTCVALLLEGTYITQGTGRGIYIDGGARHVVRDNVLFSTSTDYAILLVNCASPRTSGNIITGGYDAGHVVIAGTTTGAVLDEAFATTSKVGTASGVKATYTTTAL